MKRRVLAVLLCAAMIIGMLPAISKTVNAAPSASTTQVQELFKARSEGKHPRVLADESDFQRIRKLVLTDPYMKIWYAQVYDYSVGVLKFQMESVCWMSAVRQVAGSHGWRWHIRSAVSAVSQTVQLKN